MTGKELIEKLQKFDEETLEKQVRFYNPKYERYETIYQVRDWENFILLNEE